MKKLEILKKFFFILSQIDKLKSLYLITTLGLLSLVLEILGISLVPILIISILDPSLIIGFADKFNLRVVVEFISIKNSSIYLLITFFIIYTFKSLVMVWTNKTIIKASEDTRYRLTNYTFLKILNQNYQHFVETNSAKNIADTHVEPAQVALNFMKPFSIILTELIIILFITTGLILFNYKVTLVLFILLVFSSLLILYYTKNKLSYLGNARQRTDKEVRKVLQESFGSVKEIKLFSLENFFIGKFKPIIKESKEIEEVYQFLSILPRIWFEFVMVLMVTLLVSILIFLNYSSVEINAFIGLYATVFFRMIPSYNRLIVNFQMMRYSLPAVELTYKNLKKFDLGENKPTKKINFNNLIEFKNIFFKFSSEKDYFFKDINIQIKKNEKILINGVTGSGKTTLLSILIGMLKINKGSIVIDGNNYPSNEFMINSGYVPQTIYLLDDTIKNNILVGRDYNELRLKKCLELSQLEPYLENLPDYVDTIVGEKGTKISGGQIQRVGIARALYGNPEILILDEATNALDADTEEKVLNKILENKELTVIAISHNQRLKSLFHKKINIENRKIL